MRLPKNANQRLSTVKICDIPSKLKTAAEFNQ